MVARMVLRSGGWFLERSRVIIIKVRHGTGTIVSLSTVGRGVRVRGGQVHSSRGLFTIIGTGTCKRKVVRITEATGRTNTGNFYITVVSRNVRLEGTKFSSLILVLNIYPTRRSGIVTTGSLSITIKSLSFLRGTGPLLGTRKLGLGIRLTFSAKVKEVKFIGKRGIRRTRTFVGRGDSRFRFRKVFARFTYTSAGSSSCCGGRLRGFGRLGSTLSSLPPCIRITGSTTSV